MTSSSTLITTLERKRAALGDKEKGFTLIELLVVVLIIGVLAAVAIPIFLNQQDSAKDSSVQAAVTSAKTAVVAALSSGEMDLGDVEDAFAADGAGLEGYTPSDEIGITFDETTTGTGATAVQSFRIDGWWIDDAADTAPTADNNAFMITDSSAAEEWVAATVPAG